MKRFFKKLYFYLKNKYVVWDYSKKILSQISIRLKNPEVFKNYYLGKKNESDQFILEFINGMRLCCNRTDLSAVSETCVLNDYEPTLNFKIMPGMVVLDIGANIGDFAVCAARKGAKVFAFEPEARNIVRMKKNIILNGLEKNIVIVPAAVFSYTGKINLNFSTNSAGGHSVGLPDSGLAVDCITLEDFFKQNAVKKINLLKIDVEGAEYEILGKLSSETFSKIEKIVGEYHMGLDNDLNFTNIKKILKPHYRIVKKYYPYYFYAQH